MINVIFGSGIVGLVAKKILAGSWDIVPFGRSQYYSFNPPLADNFIIRDAEIDQPIKDLTGNYDVFFYKRCYSAGGQLVREHDDAVAKIWLDKVFGNDNDVPSQGILYLSKRTIVPIYGARISQLYQTLQNEYLEELKAEAAKGQITEIGKHYFIRAGVRTDFDNAISTIPLPVLIKLLNLSLQQTELKALDEHFVLVKSSKIDLEGYNQSYVVDSLIDFYKVSTLAPNLYMFYFKNEILQPGAYLLPIIGNAEIIDGSKIAQSIPTGQIPDLKFLDDYGIFCIGSRAQWDYFSDVGSNILKLVRYGKRGYKS